MINRFLRRIIFCLVLAVSTLGVFQSARIAYFSHKGQSLYNQTPFERSIPGATSQILILGDSTAVGTGSGDSRTSVAGYFGYYFPDASLINVSRNGLRLGGLIKVWDEAQVKGTLAPAGRYSLVVLQIGANDIMRFTKLSDVRRDVTVLLDVAKAHADRVVLMHSGNVGAAPIFIWPFNYILEARTKQVRAIYQSLAAEKGAIYVDLFQSMKDDFFLKDPAKYYAADQLHPSAAGYGHWYTRIMEELDKP